MKKSPEWTLERWEVILSMYDQIESCRAWKVESSHMCENSSRRTPRPKNLILLFFEDQSQEWSLGPYEKIMECLT